MSLTRVEKQALKSMAQSLEPVVQVGHKGVTPALIKQVDSALETHELIKVKLGKNLPEDAPPPADAIAIATHSEVIQEIGKVIVLFRKNEEKRKAEKAKRDEERRAAREEKRTKPTRPTGRERRGTLPRNARSSSGRGTGARTSSARSASGRRSEARPRRPRPRS